MSVLGIIAEFNPFHNGHRHFIQSAQQVGDFDATICVMSGNFVQRGEAAICNKWTRAHMALQAGADLVIEIPFCFCVRSAYFFAWGAIHLLNATGVVTHLAFGSENGRLGELQAVAATIADENLEYKTVLKNFLSRGMNFPAARSKTVKSITGESISNVDSIIRQPNNILAIEYLRVLLQGAISIEPFTIPRIGSQYNSLELSSYASASAIRHNLFNNPADTHNFLFMPYPASALLQQEIQAGRAPVNFAALEQALLAKLRTMPINQLREIYEISEGLENRIRKAAIACSTLEQLRHEIKSKRYSLTRINRQLLYILFNVETQRMKSFDRHGPLYFHILGFSTKGREILQEIKNKSSLRILNRGSDVKEAYHDKSEPVLQTMLELDVQATDVYSLLYPNITYRYGAQDFTTSPLFINNQSTGR